MKNTLERLIDMRDILRAKRAELIQTINDWELAGRDITELEEDYEEVMVELRTVNAEINTYRI